MEPLLFFIVLLRLDYIIRARNTILLSKRGNIIIVKIMTRRKRAKNNALVVTYSHYCLLLK